MWPTAPLSKLTSRIGDGIHGTPVYCENGGYPFVNGNNLKGGAIEISKDTKRVSQEEYDKYFIEFDEKTLFLSINGTLGNLAKYQGEEMVLGKSAAYIKCTDINVDFLYYYFQLKEVKSLMWNVATGSTIKNLSLASIRNMEIPTPPEYVADKIADVLSVIDKKIELNSRINAELEAMAKTLYDYWFVQFDFPDANGKPYKTSGGKMVYSPTLNREIPEGWEILPLSSITRVSNESISPADYPEKLFKHFSIPVFDATNTFGVERGDTIGSNKFTVKDTDLLVSKLNPWFNRVIYAMGESEQICSTEFVVWRCSNASIKNFMYMIATSPQFITHCTQSATGTSNSHKRVNPNVMMRFEQPFNLYVAEKLGQHLEPILKQLIVNQRENTKLSSLRDWLLPMLMNGQVTVRVAS